MTKIDNSSSAKKLKKNKKYFHWHTSAGDTTG